MITRIVEAITGRRIAEATTPDPGSASELAAVTEQLAAAQAEIRRLGAAVSASDKQAHDAQMRLAVALAANKELGVRVEARRPDRMVAPLGDPDTFWRRIAEQDRRNVVALEKRLAVAEGRPA